MNESKLTQRLNSWVRAFPADGHFRSPDEFKAMIVRHKVDALRYAAEAVRDAGFQWADTSLEEAACEHSAGVLNQLAELIEGGYGNA
jgi:transcriptional regulator GlxA family with amidase domain